MERRDVSFPSDGVQCRAWFYQPAAPAPGTPSALIVMAHGFSATREQRLDAYAERFCAASSFSGGHVLVVAAADPRIAAVVSQCPFTDGLATLPKLGLANLARATAAGLRDQLGALAGRSPRRMRPRATAPGRSGASSSATRWHTLRSTWATRGRGRFVTRLSS